MLAWSSDLVLTVIGSLSRAGTAPGLQVGAWLTLVLVLVAGASTVLAILGISRVTRSR